MLAPLLLAVSLWLNTTLALSLLALSVLFLSRTALRCAWKAPGQWALCAQYAVHAHLQKIPALFGQLKWRRAQRHRSEIALVDYKAPASRSGHQIKALLAGALTPMAWFQRVIAGRWQRLWSLARLQEAIGRRVDPSNVIMGSIELHGTRNIHLGRGALIYPGVYLETQGNGVITIGDDVVLSRGVHIVAFERVALGDGCMVGEYASLRDANHKLDPISIRSAGHVSAAIDIGRNAWIGRGATILKGAGIGDNSVVGANAVVTKTVAARQVVGGVPAQSLHAAAATSK